MAGLGNAGSNGNFTALALPGTQTLIGYAIGGTSLATKLYRSVDVKRDIPQTKFAAVRAAATALGARIQLLPGSWPMNTKGAKGFRVHLFHPHASSKNTVWSASNVNILLTNIETAITT